MRLTGYGKRSGPRLDVQMTPMIDVVFQLLIFFVCTVNMQGSEQKLPVPSPVELRKPSEAGGAVAEPPASPLLEDLPFIEIGITAIAGQGNDGANTSVAAWTVNKTGYATLSAVAARLDALAAVESVRREVPVYLDIADNVSMADAVATYDLCLNKRFAQVHFVAKKSSEP